MEKNELERRLADLEKQCEKTGKVTSSFFLSPAEQAQAQRCCGIGGCRFRLEGGNGACERKAAFFLPAYMEDADLDLSEYIRGIRLTAGFGTPSHRDYLGALMGLGIRREWIGDIWVSDNTAEIFCLTTVEQHILLSLDKVGRFGVKTSSVSLGEMSPPIQEVKAVRFTVSSMRCDAVCAGLFSLSRTQVSRKITAGDFYLNYENCLRPDAPVGEGAVLSLRGCGKGRVLSVGGPTRKGRLSVSGERYK